MENSKQGRRYLIIGSVLAFVSLVAIVLVLSSAGGSGSKEDVTAMVLIAREDIPGGAVALDALQSSKLTLVNAPIAEIPPTGFIINGDGDLQEEAYDSISVILNGAVIIEDLPAGSILPIGYLSWNAPLGIPEGYVAKGVQVDAVASVGGLIEPGDRVDLIATFISTDSDVVFGALDTRKTRVILQDILVLDVRGTETNEGTLTINVPAEVTVIQETTEENEGGVIGNPNQGLTRRTDYSPVNLVPILAATLEDAARIHYMETYADAITLVIRHPGDPIQEVEDIFYDSSYLDSLLQLETGSPDLGLDTVGGELPTDYVDLDAMLDLLNSMIETINQLKLESGQ